MDVAGIGAGFAGAVTAEVLREAGSDVTVVEECRDVGGCAASTGS